LAIPVTACQQPLQPRANLADPLFAATAASEYQALDLGRFLPTVVNSRGDVAGTVGIGRSQHAVVWRNGALQDLGTLPPESPDDPDTRFFSFVTAMNSRGQIVGWESFFPPLEDVRAFIWDNGVLRDLNTPGGCCGGRNIAEAISEAGHVTGVTNASGPLHAFLWRTGTMTDLGTLGGRKSFGLDVNASDLVVGWSDYDPNSEDEHAFLWASGAMQDLGTLEGQTESQALKINDAAQVIGVSGSHAFFWSRGVMQDLGVASPVAINSRGQVVLNAGGRVLVWERGAVTQVDSPGNSYSIATGINERGQIVGWSQSGSGPPHAVLWEQGRMTDLGALADAEQSRALAISNSGRVTGWSLSASGEIRALVWSKSASPNAALVVATR
jgi:probable HAF family extracellular repeat protein